MSGKKYHDYDEESNHHEKIEKIRKQKRSLKGRITEDWFIKKIPSNLRIARVIEVQKKNIFIAEENPKGLCQTDKIWLCTIAKRHFQRAHQERNFVVVGDRVAFEPDREVKFDESGEPIDTDLPRGVIQHGLPRKNQISRKDPLHPEWEHVMFANIDLIAIVASVLKPTVRFGLIDRLLVRAELDNIPAIIVLNKVDLLNELESTNKNKEFLELYSKYCTIYRNLGYEVFEISALHPRKTAPAIKQLREIFKGKMIGFIGHSGVGKSSIVNLMKPEFEQIVDENPDIFYKGRHTTTYNSLLELGIGAFAIDTPGIRAFNLESYDAQTLSACFREFKPYTCKYRSCTHDQESDCGIKNAVELGKISYERYKSYLSMLKGTE